MADLDSEVCALAAQVHDEAPAWASVAITTLLSWADQSDQLMRLRAASAQAQAMAKIPGIADNLVAQAQALALALEQSAEKEETRIIKEMN